MRLQDLQLTALGGDGSTMAPAWQMALEANFGSVDGWRKDFIARAESLRARSGWVLLSFEPASGCLVNMTLPPDAEQAPAASRPLLAFCGLGDGQEFLQRLTWEPVYARYQAAVHEASAPWAAEQHAVRGQRLLDVRRAGVYEKASQVIDGAQWRDPSLVSQWAAELRAEEPVVVYCIYGHEVGRATAMRLRAAGLDARFLDGGIDAWTAAGLPLMDKPMP